MATDSVMAEARPAAAVPPPVVGDKRTVHRVEASEKEELAEERRVRANARRRERAALKRQEDAAAAAIASAVGDVAVAGCDVADAIVDAIASDEEIAVTVAEEKTDNVKPPANELAEERRIRANANRRARAAAKRAAEAEAEAASKSELDGLFGEELEEPEATVEEAAAATAEEVAATADVEMAPPPKKRAKRTAAFNRLQKKVTDAKGTLEGARAAQAADKLADEKAELEAANLLKEEEEAAAKAAASSPAKINVPGADDVRRILSLLAAEQQAVRAKTGPAADDKIKVGSAVRWRLLSIMDVVVSEVRREFAEII